MECGELVDLDEYLLYIFKEPGISYGGFYNRIDGFYNYYDDSGHMLDDFYTQAQLQAGGRKPDIQTSMNGIRNALRAQQHATAVIIKMAGQLIGSAEHLSSEEIEYLSTLMLAGQ